MTENNETLPGTDLEPKQTRGSERDSYIDDMEFKTQVVEISGHHVLSASGEIDIYTAPRFKQAVEELLGMDVRHLIIEMHNVRYMDSSGCIVLIHAYNTLKHSGGTVNLVGCSAHIDRIIRITKLDSIFTLHQSIDDAIGNKRDGTFPSC